jgi:proteasome beta subunit
MYDETAGGQTAGTDDTVLTTGTTTVGLVLADGVVLGTDRRASLGGRFVSNKQVPKVARVHPTAAITLAGSIGGAQSFADRLRAEASLYETRRGEPPSMTALSTLAGGLLGGMPAAVSPLLGGVDASGPALFQVDAAGGVLADDYAATGSGMQLAYGVLEGNYDPDAGVAAGRGLAARAVESATERDTASGNGLVLAAITREGVELDTFDDAGEVA